MKTRVYSVLTGLVLICACGRLTADVASPATPTALNPGITGGASIEFDSKEYDFGKSSAGDPVKHVFIVTNTGNVTLLITNVHPSCGCTTAGEWTRQIDPGQTGKIPIQFNSSHYSGSVTKTIDVFSNATNSPRATLFLRGTVFKLIDIMPQTAVITMQPDSTNSASAVVRIVVQTDSLVTISDPTSSSKAFSGELKVVKPGKEYELVVTAQPPFLTGNTPASISLKTSLSNMPVLNVTAIAAVQQAVQVSPTQITISPSSGRWTTNRVFIRGNGNTPLALEDPQSTDSRIHVELVPLAMRGMFNLLVAIPPDFEIPAGQQVEVSVKSNHPRYPLLKIPIIQLSGRRAGSSQSLMPVLVKQTVTNSVPSTSPPHP